MKKTFNLPDLGEGLPDAEIVEWHVREGDVVKVDEPLVSMETAKAVVEVPSPLAGKVLSVHGQKGDVIETGSPLVEFELSEAQDTGTVAGKLETSESVQAPTKRIIANEGSKGGNAVKATPAVRALAQKLSVDLTQVTGTGPNQTITMEDVKKAGATLPPGDWEPLRGVRRAMAHSMQQSHQEIVSVTIMDDANITTWVAEGDITVRLIQAMSHAIQKEPALNAWFHGQSQSRQLLKGLQLGLAMDTEEGLFVPLMKDCEQKNAGQLRSEINELKTQVQARTIPQDQLRGHSILLSNFGKFAGRYANPIILPPTVAILGVGQIREAVIPLNKEPSIGTLLPLSLTFDHRAVTGGEASRFLGFVIEHLQQDGTA